MFNDKQPSYKSLRSIISERTNRIVVWIGAGLSAPAGLPTWQKLKDILCRALENKSFSSDPDEKSMIQNQLRRINSLNDYWLSFQILRDKLGHATYRATIRESLKTAETCSIPQNYSLILTLPITGILNLNLDRLATRAYSLCNPGKHLIEFGGYKAGHHLHILKESTPFIVNLHGMSSDESSWVLTRDDLKNLLRNDGYKNFITSCLCTRTIVFIGISADDVATGGHIDALANTDLGEHFWITDRIDYPTEYWAEHTQIQIIKYKSQKHDHSELSEILSLLGDHKALDIDADPVTMNNIFYSINLPAADELQSENDPEIIRKILNAHAIKILRPDPKSGVIDYEKYKNFCSDYDEAIYRSWYISTVPPRNRLFDYFIEEEVADGAFGRVFRAHDNNGRIVALKMLREEVRRKPDMLQSFRRGVRSMRILARRKVEGMVPYEEASEIPAIAVMEFVEGPNLQQAVESGCCKEWNTLLDISVQLANIIRRAHMLPERVLHRDLRPPNIMLKNYYIEPDTIKVVILDFDLSWHQGSQEVSVHLSSLSGFLAPEQVMQDTAMSTRNAAVDSFGIGMTLYYLRTGKEPHYLQHLHRTWEEDLIKSITRYQCSAWQSLPMRFSRLIINATKQIQSQRWDMGQIEGELELLKESVLNPENVNSAELLAEELTSRIILAGGYPRYLWDPDKLYTSLSLTSGVELKVNADESSRSVRLQIEWSNRGDREHKNVRKYLKPAMDKSISLLQTQGWVLLPLTYMRSSEAGFSVSIETTTLVKNIQANAVLIANLLAKFKF